MGICRNIGLQGLNSVEFLIFQIGLMTIIVRQHISPDHRLQEDGEDEKFLWNRLNKGTGDTEHKKKIKERPYSAMSENTYQKHTPDTQEHNLIDTRNRYMFLTQGSYRYGYCESKEHERLEYPEIPLREQCS